MREEGDTTTTRKECHEERPGRHREEGPGRDHEEWPARDYEERPARDHKEGQIGSTIMEGQGETTRGVPPRRAREKSRGECQPGRNREGSTTTEG
jgi:hypothetical protein